MIYPQVLRKWGMAIAFLMSVLSGCGEASPTPAEIVSIPTSSPIPTPIPQIVVRRGPVIPATVTPWPAATDPIPATPTGDTSTPEPSPTLPPRTERPFLMRIDRISVIVGRGTLLQGRVANGTLQGNGSVDIFGPQNKVISANVLSILVSNTVRDQVTIGDYAGILVGGIDAKDLSPGMLLAPADEFESYEEALLQLK